MIQTKLSDLKVNLQNKGGVISTAHLMLNTLELFAGTQSFSKVMREFGHNTFCIDNDKQHNSDLTIDILDIKSLGLYYRVGTQNDIVWASPPCTAFSVASIGCHWTGGSRAYIPKTEFAKLSLKIVEHTIKLISEAKPKLYYIENPRGVLRKLIDPLFEKHGLNPIRHTIWYCQYGDTRAKPTDIWTNDTNWKPKPVCKNGNPDCNHIRAPRGAKTGTQGLKGAVERSMIPPELFKEILDHNKGE